MNEFVVVAKTSELTENEMKLVEVQEQLVLLISIDKSIYCIDDVCTHDGGTLCDGSIAGFEVACPRHGATFDVRNGKATKMPATQPTGCHEVKVEGDEVLVRLNQ
ncbi:MAG: non-heme iron oxygenase ferredoxin subunit [Planctomycetota bacterium]|jgi:3-phenylpropionate/trans-cinnamate dioxygenase ferredoxin subunit|nr:non-heme iron oxygenase ferredoxin subunit [Planctomycetota bacterium]